MRRWFSGGKGHIISAFVQQTCSLKTFKTRGRDNQVSVLPWTPAGPAGVKPTATPRVELVLAPCTTPAARGQRTRCSPAGPAASPAAACCSASPCQQDRTLERLSPFTPASQGQKKDRKSAATKAAAGWLRPLSGSDVSRRL